MKASTSSKKELPDYWKENLESSKDSSAKKGRNPLKSSRPKKEVSKEQQKVEEIMYPRFGVCPFCKKELKLSDEERSGKELVECPFCEAKYNVEKMAFGIVEDRPPSSSTKQLKGVRDLLLFKEFMVEKHPEYSIESETTNSLTYIKKEESPTSKGIMKGAGMAGGMLGGLIGYAATRKLVKGSKLIVAINEENNIQISGENATNFLSEFNSYKVTTKDLPDSSREQLEASKESSFKKGGKPSESLRPKKERSKEQQKVEKVKFDKEDKAPSPDSKTQSGGLVKAILYIIAFMVAFAGVSGIIGGTGLFILGASTSRGTALQNCLDNAYELYRTNWANSCRRRGEKDNCSLPTATAIKWEEEYERDKDRCYDQYGR